MGRPCGSARAAGTAQALANAAHNAVTAQDDAAGTLQAVAVMGVSTP
jgi:hypothetical protein